jgi:flagellin-like hook-associated protein FlgL
VASSITINSNLAALNAQRRLGVSTQAVQQSFTRLSSGLRINKASDDAAGLAIAASLSTDQRVFNQGVRNVNDGISALNIADSALESLSNIVIRLEELAEQAANGTLGREQREAIDKEAQSLSKEYFRISRTAKFNGITLLDGSIGSLELQAGYGLAGQLSATFGGAIGTGGFDGTSYPEITLFTFANPLPQQESTDLTFFSGMVPDGGAFVIHSPSTAYTVWFDANGDWLGDPTGGDPNAIRVDINGVGDCDVIADRVAAALPGGVFNTEDIGWGQLRVTNVTAGTATDAADINSWTTISMHAQGTNGITDGSYVSFSSPATDYYAWFYKDGSHGDPHPGGNGIRVDISSCSTSDDVAAAFSAALASLAGEFSTQIAGFGQVRTTNLTAGPADDAQDHGSTTAITIEQQGSNEGLKYSSFASDLAMATALGDLNGDGILDLAAVGRAMSTDYAYGRIRLGRGDGTFGAASKFTTEIGWCNEIVLADTNQDGTLDLITAGSSLATGGYAAVRLGKGDGSFGAARSYAAEQVTQTAELGDLNRDGFLDLVTAGARDASGSATVRLGRGDGTFGAAVSWQTESGLTNDLALADLTGDGILDLITAGSSPFVDGGYATVRVGKGDGTFAAAFSYDTEPGTSKSLSVGDLNGDGILDLVTTGYNVARDDSCSTIRLGRGDGTFGAATSSHCSAGQFYDDALADMNGDGALDLLAVGNPSRGYAILRFGIGDGSFGASCSCQAENTATLALAVGDLNRDGVPDFVTAGMNDGEFAQTVRFSSTHDGVSPLLPFSLKTLADARQALPVFKQKLDQLSAQRGEIGAMQARLSVAVNTLQVSTENYASAESRIKDADVSEESAQLVKQRILQQAGAAVLAQADQQPQLALQLLSEI